MRRLYLLCAVFVFASLGCAATKVNPVDRFLYVIKTNYVEITGLVTNLEPVVTAGVTNLQPVVTPVVRVVGQVEFQPNPVVEGTITGVGGIVGSLWGIGGLLSTALGGAYHIYRQGRNRKTGAALVQAVEVGRELLKNTPQGQKVDDQFVAWMEKNQQAAGVITNVIKLVAQEVDNDKAASAASKING